MVLKLWLVDSPMDDSTPLACTPPVRGSDNNTVYNPQTDCEGCFISHCSENNCYNYVRIVVSVVLLLIIISICHCRRATMWSQIPSHSPAAAPVRSGRPTHATSAFCSFVLFLSLLVLIISSFSCRFNAQHEGCGYARRPGVGGHDAAHGEPQGRPLPGPAHLAQHQLPLGTCIAISFAIIIYCVCRFVSIPCPRASGRTRREARPSRTSTTAACPSPTPRRATSHPGPFRCCFLLLFRFVGFVVVF